MAAALRPVYTARSAEAAQAALEAFAAGPWGAQHPTIVKSWKSAWTQVIPFFTFPPEVRRIIYQRRLRVVQLQPPGRMQPVQLLQEAAPKEP